MGFTVPLVFIVGSAFGGILSSLHFYAKFKLYDRYMKDRLDTVSFSLRYRS